MSCLRVKEIFKGLKVKKCFQNPSSIGTEVHQDDEFEELRCICGMGDCNNIDEFADQIEAAIDAESRAAGMTVPEMRTALRIVSLASAMLGSEGADTCVQAVREKRKAILAVF